MKSKLLPLVFFFFVCADGIAQPYTDWTNYLNADWVWCNAEFNNCLWTGSLGGGLIITDKSTGAVSYLNKTNSFLPSDDIREIYVKNGEVWIATSCGLVQYDGTSAVYYNVTNSGLPDNFVSSISEDNSGNLWLGTGNGLAKYDGSSFTVYNTQNSLIVADAIVDVTVDNFNRVWIATHNGLGMYDGTFYTYNTGNSVMPINLVDCIFVDSQFNVWVANYFVVIRIHSWGNWTLFDASSGIGCPFVHDITEDTNGKIWFATCTGVSSYDGTAWENFNFTGTQQNSGYSVFIDASDTLWIGSQTAGLYKKDGVTLVNQNLEPSPLANYCVSKIFVDDSGKKWIASDVLQTFNDTVWTTESCPGCPSSLGGVLDIQKDSQGNLWMGNEDLVKYDGTTYTAFIIPFSAQYYHTIKTLAIDSNDHVWMAHQGIGLLKFDGINWSKYDSSNSPLSDWQVYAVAVAPDNSVWVWDLDGYWKFDGSTWTNYPTSVTGCWASCNRMVFDNAGVLYCATTGGLVIYDGTTWTLYDKTNSPLPENSLKDLAFDHCGNLWISTYDCVSSGLAKYDGINWEIYNMANSGLSSDQVFSIAIDASDHKWMATCAGGISVLNDSCMITGLTNNPGPIHSISIYPNPVTENVKITCNSNVKEIRSVTIINTLGQQFLLPNFNSNNILETDVSGLMTGIYFVRVDTDLGVFVGKLVRE